jgi:hypothetical protein
MPWSAVLGHFSSRICVAGFASPYVMPISRYVDLAFYRPSSSMTSKELFHGREEVLYLDRFALEGVESCIQHPLPVIGHHRRGHGHNGNLSSGNLGS